MNKYVKFIVSLSLFSILTACSTNTTVYKDVDSLVTHMPNTPETDDLQCFSKKLSENGPYSGVIISVGSFLDGSVPSAGHNGPLMDQGKFLFQHYLMQAIPRTEGVILTEYPLIFSRKNSGNVGKDRYGVPQRKDLAEFSKTLIETINTQRKRSDKSTKAEKRNKVRSLAYYKVHGVFTRNDGNDVYSKSGNINPEYSDSNGKANISFTKNTSNKIMGLTINLVDPVYNHVVDSQSFRVEYDTLRNRYRVSLGYHDVSLSGNMSTTITESSDSAQDALIRASALWTVNRMYDFNFYKPVQTAMKKNGCKDSIL